MLLLNFLRRTLMLPSDCTLSNAVRGIRPKPLSETELAELHEFHKNRARVSQPSPAQRKAFRQFALDLPKLVAERLREKGTQGKEATDKEATVASKEG
jgi:hypothetical protein